MISELPVRIQADPKKKLYVKTTGVLTSSDALYSPQSGLPADVTPPKNVISIHRRSQGLAGSKPQIGDFVLEGYQYASNIQLQVPGGKKKQLPISRLLVNKIKGETVAIETEDIRSQWLSAAAAVLGVYLPYRMEKSTQVVWADRNTFVATEVVSDSSGNFLLTNTPYSVISQTMHEAEIITELEESSKSWMWAAIAVSAGTAGIISYTSTL